MKLIRLIIVMILAASLAYAEKTQLNENKVIQMATVIASKYKYTDQFDFKKAYYNEKTKTWSLYANYAYALT
jgi:FKBP-type peptidyl-prolyl cis-trans isomerase (trigger factor)